MVVSRHAKSVSKWANKEILTSRDDSQDSRSGGNKQVGDASTWLRYRQERHRCDHIRGIDVRGE